MTTASKDPILVVVQLTGGNDYMNTVIPYNNSLYYENRRNLSIPPQEALPIDGEFGLHPAMAPLKELYDQGKMAVINGIGYPNPNRSHFRSMDIWHTCEPDKIGEEGWLGRVIRDLDPRHENVLTGVNFGRGLPRAMAVGGVPVASVSMLESYGILTSVQGEPDRSEALELFSKMYGPMIGTGPVMDYIGQTGLDALKGADILKTAPQRYQSSVEYANSSVGRNLQGIAKVLLAGFGTRVFYAMHGGYDTHANQGPFHPKLLGDLSRAISDFYDDLREHSASENTLIFVFTEFGRRVKDNGSGTDHGAGGVAFAIGDPVKGGMYSEYPSLKPSDLVEGDLKFNIDFRGVYSTMVEWMGLDPVPVVGGQFEQADFV